MPTNLSIDEVVSLHKDGKADFVSFGCERRYFAFVGDDIYQLAGGKYVFLGVMKHGRTVQASTPSRSSISAASSSSG